MMGCAKYWYSWDADNTDERRLTRILLIISKINQCPSVYFVLSASSDIKLTHHHSCNLLLQTSMYYKIH